MGSALTDSSSSKLTNLVGQMSQESDNVWSSILSEVRSNITNKLPSGKVLVVLGDSEVGKTTLLAKLQGIDAPKKGSGLEFGYLDIRDEYRDDSTQLGVWVLDGNSAHSHLLQFTLSESTFSETLILLTVSMATPWSILEQLSAWARVLNDYVDSLRLSPDRVRELRDRCTRKWIEYVEPGDEVEGVGKLAKDGGKGSGEDEELMLGNILTRNMGLDIIVVVTKTDHISILEKEHEFRDEQFDFIQYHIRLFCAQYGASLFYTSVKEDKNCDLLYKYLVHRIYHLPFRTPALIVEKDAVFIPAGWDNDKKMAILHENMTSFKPDEYYNDVIPKPVSTRKTVRAEIEVEIEDEQSFLDRQLLLLNQATNPKDMRQTPSPHAKKPTGTPTITPSSGGTPRKGDQPTDRVLANFFNSLLSKKSGGSPGSPKAASNDESLRSEVTAELDSLMSKKETNSLNSTDC